MLILILGLFVQNTQSQVINIPDKSKAHFAQKYPNAKKVDWSNNVTSYVAKFKVNNNTHKSYYHMDGTWDYSVMYMLESQLPAAVKESVAKSRIASWKPKSAAHVENNKGEHTYRVEREKGLEKKYIFFDQNGKEVKAMYKL